MPPPFTVIRAPAANRAIQRLSKDFPGIEADVQAFFDEQLAERPHQLGDPVPGTGGMRKIRSAIPSAGIGKRGGLRHICFIHQQARVVIVVLTYYKGDRENVLAREVKRSLAQSLPALEESIRSKGVDPGKVLAAFRR